MAIISMDRMGNVRFLDENEHEITDYYEIQDIKKYSNWKEIVYKQSLDLINKFDNNIAQTRNIYKETDKLITKEEIKAKISEIKLQEYIIPDYPKRPEESLKNQAYNIANKEVKTHISLFPPLTFKARKRKYIEERIPTILEELSLKEKEDESKYYSEQRNVKLQKDTLYKQEYTAKVREYEKYISKDETLINIELKRLYGKDEEREDLDSCFFYLGESPIACLNFYHFSNGNLKAWLVLPKQSMIENRKATMLASNKVSVKFRRAEEIIEDWHLCCCGLILNAFAKLFNVNTNIHSIELESIYFQKDEAIGEDKECTYDNTFFTRENFSQLNISAINPIKTIERFHKNENINEKINDNNESDFRQNEDKANNRIQYSESYVSPDCLDEASINMICSCLSEIISQFGTDCLYKDNSKKFHNICNDLYPDNKDEIDFLMDLSEEGILEELLLKKFKDNFTTRLLTIGSNYTNNEILSIFLERLSQMFS